MRRHWSYVFLCASIFLSGCSVFSGNKSHACSSYEGDNGTGYYSQDCQQKLLQQALKQKLISDGIEVVQVGDETTLVFSSNRFFNVNSNNPDIDAGFIKDIADFINSYSDEGVIDVGVTGYPKIAGNKIRNLALARARAEKIAHDLHEAGLDSRLISADSKDDVSEESRIEIFFRLAPPTNVFH